jgi:hypothetical protein
MAHDTRLDNLSDLVRLIWSKNYEIKFDDKTIDEILDQAIILENKFKSDEFPLITNDQKYKIAKLSASLACLLCSFGKDSPSEQKFGEVIVTEEHVKYISKLIDKEYCKAGLDEIAKQSRFGVINSDIIYEIVNGICVKTNDDDKANSIEILKWCATQSKITRDDLQEEFALSRDKQAQPLLTYLRNEKILKTSRNHYSITKKGVSVARFITNYSHEKMSDITRKNESSASSASSPSKTDTPTNNNNNLGGVSLLVDLERLEALKIKDFTCNDCNTTWNHTRLTLEEITKNHDKTHNIMESLQ